jgi:hypothetical protein
MEMIYEIKNLNHFAKKLGKLVAKDAGFTQKELKESIKVVHIKNLICQYCNGHKNGKLLIDENNTSIICSEIFSWLIGVDLAKMAAQDILDCYWDDNLNEMVFKHKDKK